VTRGWAGDLLAGDVAVVTGAGRGIGRAVAVELRSVGANVALFDRDADLLGAAVEHVGATTGIGQVSGVQVDVTDVGGINAAVAKVVDDIGDVTILVNNAGVVRDAYLGKMTLEQFDTVIDVHLRGAFICAKACLEPMRRQGRGAIVGMSSSTGPYGNPGQVNYGAAKAGIIGLTRTLAVELARFGIRVNAVAPGAIDTDMLRGIPDDLLAGFLEQIPLGRLGAPEEVAALVTFLASPLASYITGHVYFIDGGSTVAG
jgi:3-oxoacyl-[acyl-carrier protein] reductase